MENEPRYRMIGVEEFSLETLREFIEKDGLGGVLLWAQAVVNAVPLEHRGDVDISVYMDRDTGWEMGLNYTRPETDLDRQNDDRKRREQEARRHTEEYQQFLRLKAKYGSGQ